MAARILFNALAAVPGGGGVSRYATELGKRLALADERVTLLCTADGAALFNQLPSERKIVWNIPPLPKGRLLLEEFRLPKLADQYDLLYQPDFKLPRGVNTPAIVTAHDLFFEEYPRDYSFWQRRYKVRQASRAAAAANAAQPRVAPVSLTNHVAKKVQARYQLSEPPRVIPTGIAAEEFPAREPAVPAHLLFVGADNPRKNGALLHDACRLSGWRDEQLRSTGVWRGRPASVTGLGILSDAALRGQYSQAAALLLPSRDEGFGLPALEAIAAGCPVICSDIPVLRESFAGCAKFVPLTPENWAEAIHSALATPPSLDPAARAAMLEKFDWGKSLAAHRRLIDDVLGSRA